MIVGPENPRDKILEKGTSYSLTSGEINMEGLKFFFRGLLDEEVKITVVATSGKELEVLAKGYEYDGRKQRTYCPSEAHCVSIFNRPMFAIVKGTYSGDGGPYNLVSLANIADDRSQVVVKAGDTGPLFNYGNPWVGYNMEGHEEDVKLGREAVIIRGKGQGVEISIERIKAYGV